MNFTNKLLLIFMLLQTFLRFTLNLKPSKTFKELSKRKMETRRMKNENRTKSAENIVKSKKTPIKIEYEVENVKKSIKEDIKDVKVSKKNINNKRTNSKNEDSNVQPKIKMETSGAGSNKNENLDIKKVKKEPQNWQELLANIREMRKNADAPVDTMGCDMSPDKNILPEVRRYHILTSLMLSSQTKDEVNHAAMGRLKKHGLTIDNIRKMDEDTLGQLIHPVGFWRTKAKHIKQVSEILKGEYNGDIPNTVESLCKLPGVGPKMAHICMKSAWGIITGIGVDVHVHRISHRLGWTKTFKSPEHTRVELESWLPENLWGQVNHLLVGFGQTICKPINPSCESCLNNKICPKQEPPKKNSPKKKM